MRQHTNTMPHGFFYVIAATARDIYVEAKAGAIVAAVVATVITGLQQAPQTWAEAWSRLAEVNMIAFAGWVAIMALSFVVRLIYLWTLPGRTGWADYSEHAIEWSARIIFWALLAFVLLIISHMARQASAAASWIELFGFLVGATGEGFSLIALYGGERGGGFIRWMLKSGRRFFVLSDTNRAAFRRGVDGAMDDAERLSRADPSAQEDDQGAASKHKRSRK